MKNEKIKFYNSFQAILQKHHLGDEDNLNKNFPKIKEELSELWKYRFANRYTCVELYKNIELILKENLYNHTSSSMFRFFSSTEYDTLYASLTRFVANYSLANLQKIDLCHPVKKKAEISKAEISPVDIFDENITMFDPDIVTKEDTSRQYDRRRGLRH